MHPNPHAAEIEAILRRTTHIAVVGAHTAPHRAGCYVGEYLAEQGYVVYPVNPVFEGQELFGRTVLADLAQLPEPVQLVDVFRASQHIPGLVPEILAMDPLPAVVWLQQGIRNDHAAEQLAAAGITVVQDRCTLADHRRFLA